MTIEDIKYIAKTFTIECYRNSYIEDLHSKIKELDDIEMKKLNKDIYNKVYTYLLLFLSDNQKGYDIIANRIAFYRTFNTLNWDEPEIDKTLLSPYELNIIKQIEKQLKEDN